MTRDFEERHMRVYEYRSANRTRCDGTMISVKEPSHFDVARVIAGRDGDWLGIRKMRTAVHTNHSTRPWYAS
jgi:hypothetical protein